MNAGLRQEYNAYVAQISVLESVNAAIRGNLTTAANVVDNYYKTNVQFLQDKANNYNLLLSSAGTELNRLTEVQKQDIQTQIDLLNSQISDEKAKQATYNTILASPSYQKAVTQYQLSPSDDIYTQASKIQQAEAEDKILTDLMTTYFDAGITLKDSLISAKEKLLLSPTYQQKVNKSTGTISTTDVLNLATSLYNSDPYTYGSVANAIPAAMQYANLVEGGANPDVSLLYVNNNNTADRSTVDKQIQDVATFVFGNSDIGSVSVRQEKVRAIKQYATAGDYDTLEQYLYTTATQGLSADEQKTFNSNIMVTAAFEAIQPELQKLYNEYGFNGKLGLKYVNGALQFFGETPVDANQQAILAKVNTMIQSSFVKYRQSLTGAQFSNAESEAYQKLWLDIKNSQALNDAIFSGQYATAKSSTNAYLSKVIGENGVALLENLRGANNIFKTYKNNTVMGDIAASYATDVAGFNAAYIGRYGNYECGQYVNQYIQEQTGKYGIFGDSIDSKIEAIKKYGGLTDTSNYQFEVGDIIVQKFNKQQDPKQYGHVAIVRKVYPNGTLDLAEANYNGDKKITYGRVINSNSSTIAGVLPRKILTK